MQKTPFGVLLKFVVAPKLGFEPRTNWLTANCSTAELFRNKHAY